MADKRRLIKKDVFGSKKKKKTPDKNTQLTATTENIDN